MEQERKLARERASIILQVRSGALTATEGAERLGVSRKTYYEWEDRALEAMALALENHPHPPGCGERRASDKDPGSGEEVVPGGEDDRGEGFVICI
jgi:DNA-binding XRE family transcriptional regulator